MTKADATLDRLCVDTVRTLSVDAVQRANSGHPGLPLGAAPMGTVLFTRHLKFDPSTPDWPDRDRFVLSAGHGSALLYSLLHLSGYELSIDDLKRFRQWGSNTPGHPEFGMTPGVEATTGPLGQGAANAVGMAMAERILSHRFNRPGHGLVDHYTYALVSDGDLMEGLSSEAASLAGHLGLGKLIYLYDSNEICLDGPTNLTFTEDVAGRYEAYGWQVLEVGDGDTDLEGLDRAIAEARAEDDRPSLIIVRTTIGFGSPNKAGSASAHGSPLGEDEVARTKAALGWEAPESFFVPGSVAKRFDLAAQAGKAQREQWQSRLEGYTEVHPELAAEWHRTLSLQLNLDDVLVEFEAGTQLATRVASGKILNAAAKKLPFLIGGDADLSCSTMTALEGESSFDGTQGEGRNIHFGVREHAMGAIQNGMAYHGGVLPYSSTFFCFADYMRPSMRLAALSELPVIYVFTHDSIGVGEDGPTHQPVEHLMSLRAMPNLHVVRPADAGETALGWRQALERRDGPTALVLSRQGLPVLDPKIHPVHFARKGGYILAEAETDGQATEPALLLIATGSEVATALAARDLLQSDGIPTRVVSMPCWEVFEAQPEDYRTSVLPPAITARVSIEAGATLGWERHIGTAGIALGLDRFGASAPGPTNFDKFGLTAERVAETARTLLP